MSDLVKIMERLPATIGGLKQYIIISRAKLKAHRLKVDTATRLNLAKELRDEALHDGQEMAEHLLVAEAKYGALLREAPKHQGRRSDKLILTDEEKLDKNADKNADRFYRLAENPTVIAQVCAEAREREEIPTRNDVLQAIHGAKTHQGINLSTSNEWYTPARYIDAAREVMGGIDLDPASNAFANKVVGAIDFYNQNGLGQPWYGRVWLNPPYGHSEEGGNQALWSHKLLHEYTERRVDQACLLVNAVPGNKWFAPLWAYLICFVDHRIRFYDTTGEAGQPTHSNAIVYLGANTEAFVRGFSDIGPVAARLTAS